MNEPADLSPKPIVLKTDTGFGYFDYEDIILFRAEGHKVECLTIAGEPPIRVYHSLSELEKKHGGNFLQRCNRSTIVNLRHIKNLETKAKKLHLNNDIVLNISDGFIKILRSSSKNNNHEKKYPVRKSYLLRKVQIIIKRIRYRHKKTTRVRKTIKFFFFLIIVLMTANSCESQEKFYRPDLKEQLCCVGVIDMDETPGYRHLLPAYNSLSSGRYMLFEKSYQNEHKEVTTNLLQEFSFSISTDKNKIFDYKPDEIIPNYLKVNIPDSIEFSPYEKYYLRAQEKECAEISAEISVTERPPVPILVSVKKELIPLSSPMTGRLGKVDTLKSAVLKITFDNTGMPHQFYALILDSKHTMGGMGSILFDDYLRFSVKECNTSGFFAEIYGMRMFSWLVIEEGIDNSNVFAFFIDGNNIPGNKCNITLSTLFHGPYSTGQMMGWDDEFYSSLRVKLLSITEEVYNFEKSLCTYNNIKDDPFAEPVYLNGNIKGGHGVFAICRSSELIVDLVPPY